MRLCSPLQSTPAAGSVWRGCCQSRRDLQEQSASSSQRGQPGVPALRAVGRPPLGPGGGVPTAGATWAGAAQAEAG